jgi:predicted esterase
VAALALSCRSSRSTQHETGAAEPTIGTAPATTASPAESSPASDRPEVDAAEPGLPPLGGTDPLVALQVEGYAPAVVALPVGTTEPRPLVVAMHGNFDRPQWQCEVWREATGAYPFVLCPRGKRRTDVSKSMDRWTYVGGKSAEKELLAGLEALAVRYGEYVAAGPVVFIGFSLGAIIGKGILRRHGERFPRAVLIEGGNKRWSRASVADFAGAGGKRVLFACGQTACKHLSKRAARLFEAQEVDVKVVFGGNIGHTYDAQVADAVVAEWSWLVEGDERWRLEVRDGAAQ